LEVIIYRKLEFSFQTGQNLRAFDFTVGMERCMAIDVEDDHTMGAMFQKSL
jgi:hypothetical protein